jgi:hypothetical protein
MDLDIEQQFADHSQLGNIKSQSERDVYKNRSSQRGPTRRHLHADCEFSADVSMPGVPVSSNLKMCGTRTTN